MPDDVFTFVRIKYNSNDGGWGRRGGKWRTDYPDSDLNFSYRLQELTSMEVDPDGKILELTDPELFDYPFVYMIEPGDISLDQEEIEALRKYLLNGGFMMVDDFWGDLGVGKFLPGSQAGVPGPRARGAPARTPDLPLRLRPAGEAAGACVARCDQRARFRHHLGVA